MSRRFRSGAKPLARVCHNALVRDQFGVSRRREPGGCVEIIHIYFYNDSSARGIACT